MCDGENPNRHLFTDADCIPCFFFQHYIINCYEVFVRMTHKLVEELCFRGGGDCRSGKVWK